MIRTEGGDDIAKLRNLAEEDVAAAQAMAKDRGYNRHPRIDAMEAEHAAVSHAIMEAQVRWGWTFGKRAKVMAIDELMADAAIAAIKATPPQGDAT